MDLLKRYSIISLLSTASVKGIFANDVQLVYGYDFDVFSFKDNDTTYYFKFNDIIINKECYTLTQNEKLANLVLQKLLPKCKKLIENIKNDIIEASKQEEFDKSAYDQLMFKTSITKLNTAQLGQGSYLKVIKNDGKYYKDFYALYNDNEISLKTAYGTERWKDDTSSCHDLYVVNSIRINNDSLAKVIKDITSISEDTGKELAYKLESFCRNKINIGSFEELNKDTDFKKEIIRKFKDSDNNISYWEVDRALAAGYFDKFLDNEVNELKKERDSILTGNKQFKLKVMFYDGQNLSFEYEYFDVKPQTTYAELYGMLLKKCAENLNTDKDYLYTSFYVNGNKIDNIDSNKNSIKLDITKCVFDFYKSECKKSDANEEGVVVMKNVVLTAADDDDDNDNKKPNAKEEKAKIEESIKENEKKLEDNKQLISVLKSESENALTSATEIKLDIKQEELNNVVEEIKKDKEDKGKKKDEEIKKEDINNDNKKDNKGKTYCGK